MGFRKYDYLRTKLITVKFWAKHSDLYLLTYNILFVSKEEAMYFWGAISYVGVGLLEREVQIIKIRQSVRTLSLSIILFGFITYSFYTATLTSSMTVLEAPVQIKSFSDLLKYEFKSYTSKGTIFETIIKSAKPGTDLYDVYQQDMKNNPKAFGRQIMAEIEANPKSTAIIALS